MFLTLRRLLNGAESVTAALCHARQDLKRGDHDELALNLQVAEDEIQYLAKLVAAARKELSEKPVQTPT